MKTRNVIAGFTGDEIEFYLAKAGFTGRERRLFLLRQDEVTLEEATEALNCSLSTVNRINATMKRKMRRAALSYGMTH